MSVVRSVIRTCRAIQPDEDVGLTELCTECKTRIAVWNATIYTPPTLVTRVGSTRTSRACKRCIPLQNRTVARLITDEDRFLVQQRNSRYKYSRLIDCCRQHMQRVLENPRLNDIYIRIGILGESVGKDDLHYAWKWVTDHLSK